MFLHLAVMACSRGGGGVGGSRGSLSRGGLCLGEVSVQGGICQGDHPRIVKSGRYASYWNAFLFVTYFHNHLLFSPSIRVSIKTMGTATEW